MSTSLPPGPPPPLPDPPPLAGAAERLGDDVGQGQEAAVPCSRCQRQLALGRPSSDNTLVVPEVPPISPPRSSAAYSPDSPTFLSSRASTSTAADRGPARFSRVALLCGCCRPRLFVPASPGNQIRTLQTENAHLQQELSLWRGRAEALPKAAVLSPVGRPALPDRSGPPTPKQSGPFVVSGLPSSASSPGFVSPCVRSALASAGLPDFVPGSLAGAVASGPASAILSLRVVIKQEDDEVIWSSVFDSGFEPFPQDRRHLQPLLPPINPSRKHRPLITPRRTVARHLARRAFWLSAFEERQLRQTLKVKSGEWAVACENLDAPNIRVARLERDLEDLRGAAMTSTAGLAATERENRQQARAIQVLREKFRAAEADVKRLESATLEAEGNLLLGRELPERSCGRRPLGSQTWSRRSGAFVLQSPPLGTRTSSQSSMMRDILFGIACSFPWTTSGRDLVRTIEWYNNIVPILDIVGMKGMVYAVEMGYRSGRDLVRTIEWHNNIVLILGDARHPLRYRLLFSMVDVIFADAAQQDQAQIVGLTAQNYLKVGRGLVVCINASFGYFAATDERNQGLRRRLVGGQTAVVTGAIARRAGGRPATSRGWIASKALKGFVVGALKVCGNGALACPFLYVHDRIDHGNKAVHEGDVCTDAAPPPPPQPGMGLLEYDLMYPINSLRPGFYGYRTVLGS
ncbi:MAG: Small subunit processome complex component [Phylliscum demangeonii]|nr:MAG: Small subunit processome complex component [Phylliscum demangeonii]